MSKYKLLNKSYQLKSGKWVPEVHLCEETAEGMDVFRLLAPEERQFTTKKEAENYCELFIKKWIKLR